MSLKEKIKQSIRISCIILVKCTQLTLPVNKAATYHANISKILFTPAVQINTARITAQYMCPVAQLSQHVLMADNPKTKLTYFLLEFNTCNYQAAIFGILHTCDYVKNKHLTHRFNFYQLEVDGKPVGE